MVNLLGCLVKVEVDVDVSCLRITLLYAGAGLDWGLNFGQQFVGGKGGGADGQGEEGGDGDDNRLFHGDTPFVPVGLMKHVWYISRSVPFWESL